MTNMKWIILRLAQLVLEFSAVYLFLVPPYLFKGELPPVWPVALALLVGGVGYLFFRKRGKRLAGIISALLTLLVGMVFGLSPMFAIILGVVAAWRFSATSSGNVGDTELLATYLSVAYGLAAYFLIGGGAGNQLLKLLILQFGLAVFVRGAKSILETGDAGRKQDRALLILLAVVVLFTGVVFYLEPIIEHVAPAVAWLFGGIGRLFGFIASPFFNATGPFLESLRNEAEKLEEEEGEREEEEFQYPGSENAPDTTSAEILFLFLFAAAGIAVTLYLINRSRKALSVDGGDTLNVQRMPIRDDHGRTSRFFQPADPIRKEVFRLERRMSKKGRGRRAGQTFGEWLVDLGAGDDAAIVLNDIYVSIRYGEQQVSSEEVAEFKRLIRKIG